jgi:putative membrane protein
MGRFTTFAGVAACVALATPGAALAHGEDRVPVSRLESWQPALIPIGATVLALLLFAQGFMRLRRRGRSDYAGGAQALLFLLGLAVLTLPLVSPLDAIGDEYLLSAHMLQHVLIGDLAPALLVLAVRGPLTFFLLPAPLLRSLARNRPLRTALHFLLQPWVSFAIWTLVIAAWHVPGFFDYALAHQWAHHLEHGSFVLAGVLVWSQLIDPARRRALSDRKDRAVYAIALLAAGHTLVHPILFGQTALYAPYVAQDERLLGLSPSAISISPPWS